MAGKGTGKGGSKPTPKLPDRLYDPMFIDPNTKPFRPPAAPKPKPAGGKPKPGK